MITVKKLFQFLVKLLAEKFYGKVIIEIEAGTIVRVVVEHSIKEL